MFNKKDLTRAVAASFLAKIASMFSIVCSLLLVYYFLYPNDYNISAKGMTLVFVIGILLALLETFLIKTKYRFSNVPAYNQCEELRLNIAEKLNSIPYEYFNRNEINSVANTILDDCVTVEALLADLLPNFLSSLIFFPVLFIVSFFINFKITLSMLAVVPVAFAVELITMKYEERHINKQIKAKQEANISIHEFIEGMGQIKANSQNNTQFKQLDESLKELKYLSLKMELLAGVFTVGAEVILQIGIGLVVLVSTVLLAAGEVSPFVCIVFFVLMLTVYPAIAEMITAIPSVFYDQKVVKSRIEELLNYDTEKAGVEKDLSSLEIEFKNVSFGYTAEKEVLHSINLVAKAGEVTAIVGSVGSGKTTIANLISRLWRPNDGEILLGEKNIGDYDPGAFTSFVTCVFQNVVLFNDTIFNNIKIGNPNATDEEVLMASKLARCDEFISKLPDGMNTVLLENGKSLSGGERQRISIARAILKNAPIVILDEATSSLDTINEYYIHEAITELCKDKTVIVIAHTLRNVVNANKIYVLQNGSVAESGTSEELYALNGIYKKLYDSQTKALKWAI